MTDTFPFGSYVLVSLKQTRYVKVSSREVYMISDASPTLDIRAVNISQVRMECDCKSISHGNGQDIDRSCDTERDEHV